jgi:2'-5' RNA ligase
MDILTNDDSMEFYENSRKFPYLCVLLKIPEELWRPLLSVQRELQSIDPRQLYCPPSYFHITLKEIGGLGSTVNEKDLPKIRSAIEKVADMNSGFRVDFGELKTFPSVIYLSITEGVSAIRKLHLDLIRELYGLAVKGPFEGPDMIPHLTLLLFMTKDVEPLLRHVQEMKPLEELSIHVEEITLVKSHSYRLFGSDNERDVVNEEMASFRLPDPS